MNMNDKIKKKPRVKKQISKPIQPIEGSGLLHDVFVKPFRPDKSVKALIGDSALYSKMANESYKRTDASLQLDGYSKDTSLSQINAVVYRSSDQKILVMAVRGTNPSNISDLATDVAVATGTLKASKRYKDISNLFNKVYKKYGPYVGKSLIKIKYVIAGHSLGSSLALQLLLDNPDKIDSIYLYNPGSSADTVKKGLQMKIGKALGIGFYKKVSKKINIFRVAGDPISLTSRFLNGTYTSVESSKLDRHGMANFLPKEDEPQKATVRPQTGPRVNSWSSSKPVDTMVKQDPNLAELKLGFGGKPVDLMIKKDEVKPEVKPVETEQKSDIGSGVNKNKNKNLYINKTMDVDTMNKKQMMDVIRNNKKYKVNLSGYSKMPKEELRSNLKKVMSGEVVSKRASVKPSPWLVALKEFNKDKATYSIPKKGTKEHEAVLALMKGDIVIVDKPKSKRSKVVPV
jgi:hypothetical protein